MALPPIWAKYWKEKAVLQKGLHWETENNKRGCRVMLSHSTAVILHSQPYERQNRRSCLSLLDSFAIFMLTQDLKQQATGLRECKFSICPVSRFRGKKKEKQKIKGEGLSIQLVLYLASILKTTLLSWHKECIFQRSIRVAALQF